MHPQQLCSSAAVPQSANAEARTPWLSFEFPCVFKGDLLLLQKEHVPEEPGSPTD